jgi:hypothetical protein
MSDLLAQAIAAHGCRSPKSASELNVIHVTSYTASPYVIHFKCAPDFGERQVFEVWLGLDYTPPAAPE